MDYNSDEETDEQNPSWRGVSGTIILICGYDPSNTGFPVVAYESTCELMRLYLRSPSSQLFGVIIYGATTENPSTSNSVDTNIFSQLVPLSVPNLGDFQKLRAAQPSSWKISTEFKLSDVLWQCSKMFTNCKKILATKTVILMSKLDIIPVQADQKPALKRVVDLVDAGIEIKVINTSNSEYDIHEFYKTLMTEARKGGEIEIPIPLWDHTNIIKTMQKHSHRNLAVASLSFDIGEYFSIGVRVYNILQTNTKPKKVRSDRQTSQIVNSVTVKSKVLNDTGDNEMDIDEPQASSSKEVPVLKSEILFYQIFGDKRIEFTSDEMKTLNNPFGQMFKLLGFKPATILAKEKWFVKSCHFLYPNESLIEGSTQAFKALHQACTETSVVAICMLCARVNAKPRLVGLLPCSNPFGMDVTVGFNIIYIPFVENCRAVPSCDEVGTNQIDVAHKIFIKDIIKGLKFNYEPEMFENPALQSLLLSIEALALESEDPPVIVDTTKPDPVKFESIDAELFENFFGPFTMPATKRPQANNNTTWKRTRTEDVEVDEVLLESRLSSNKIESYTVKELKDILKFKNLPNLPALTGLKKQELVRLVYDRLGS